MELVNNPIFLQSAGNVQAGEKEGVIKLMFNTADPTIQSITGTGDITIKSIKDGEVVTDTVTDPSEDAIAVSADANSWIEITGEVTEFEHTGETKLIKIEAKNTALTSLSCSSCSALQTLDLSKNTALTSLSCSDIAKITSISYPATNSDVATAIAGAITAADAEDGTVYTDSAADYYSTIATAANDKGWTIEPIAA